jgi:hypothetical protein
MQAQELLSDLHPIDLRKELFRRQDFSFITVRDGKRHIKQEQALFTLTNSVTEEFLYGGAAGGAKSWGRISIKALFRPWYMVLYHQKKHIANHS